jgi:thiamine-phosphate pyrophosphorylase
MLQCYSVAMSKRQPALPSIWLVSDARNDHAVDQILRRLPRGSGLIFRHYHLEGDTRRKRFDEVKRLAKGYGHTVALGSSPAMARRWGTKAVYGPAGRLARGPALCRLVTAHSLREIGAAHRARASAILLSAAFATRSHPGRSALGLAKFRLLASRALVPVIALGGMNPRRARQLGTARWAAVDGLCDKTTCWIPKDS